MDQIFDEMAFELKITDVEVSKEDLISRWDNEEKRLRLSYLKLVIPPLNAIKKLEPEILDLSHNNLISIPDKIGELTKLRILNISHNAPFSNISSHRKRAEFENKNPPLVIPGTIGRLALLEELSLDCNYIHSLPEEIGQLENLRTLSIENAFLYSIPTSIGKLTNLWALNLDFNLIKYLPEECCSLKNLEILSLRDNELNNLPNTLDNLVNLISIDLRDNNIESLPETLVKLRNLRKIAWDWEKVVLPSNWSISELDLSNQGLHKIPESVFNLSNLVKLDLSRNRINQIPQGIERLVQLEYLDLSDNRLDQLPDELSNLQLLNSLDLSRNEFSTIPSVLERIGSLEQLHLESNNIENYPENLASLTRSDSHLVLDKAQRRIVKVLMLGDPSVGKTSIKLKFLEKDNKDYIISENRDFVSTKLEFDTRKYTLQIWDLATLSRFKMVRDSFYREASGVLLIYSIDNSSSFEALPNWLVDIINNHKIRIIPFLVVGNKSDLKNKREVKKEIAQSYAKQLTNWTKSTVEYMETSAKTGENISELFSRLIDTINIWNLRYIK